MKILNQAILSLAKLRAPALDYFLQGAQEAQRGVLQYLVSEAQHTEFGRKHKFTRTFRLKDFKQQVPLQEYPDIQPYVDRMIRGEKNILWNSPIEWFAKSSGTSSGRSKFIPISQESLQRNHYQANKDLLFFYYLSNPECSLLLGKGLVIGGSHQIAEVHSDIFFGDLSAVLLQNSPFWGDWIRTPELSIALMDDWEKKLEAITKKTIHENVTSVSGVPTWTQVLFRRILERTGKKTILDVWPNLELYFHGGVSFEPYRKSFETLVGGPIKYQEIYNASEGFFAAQIDQHHEGMTLFLDHGIFFEFLPIEEYETANPKTIGLQEVELGKNYAPVISTTGGLWRYLIGDTIQFTNLNPYRIRVSGRLKHYINAFGEELIIDNSDKAIAEACAKTGALVNDYTAAPVFFKDNENGAHEWIVAFEMPPANVEVFADILDTSLREINSDYDAKRFKDIALRRLILHAAPKDLFNEWLQSKGKLGGQHKVPRLSNDRTVLEEILRMLPNKPISNHSDIADNQTE